MRRRVACLGAVVVLSAVLPTARAHAVVEPGGCQNVRAVGSVQLVGEQVDATVYERSCGPRVIVEDAAIITLGARPYRASVQVVWGGRVVATATDGAPATGHVVWVQRAIVGGSVRVVVQARGEAEEVTVGDG